MFILFFFNTIRQDLPGISEVFINSDTPIGEYHQNVTFPEKKERYDYLFFSKEFSKTLPRLHRPNQYIPGIGLYRGLPRIAQKPESTLF
jgi:hypothetical protein